MFVYLILFSGVCLGPFGSVCKITMEDYNVKDGQNNNIFSAVISSIFLLLMKFFTWFFYGSASFPPTVRCPLLSHFWPTIIIHSKEIFIPFRLPSLNFV